MGREKPLSGRVEDFVTSAEKVIHNHPDYQTWQKRTSNLAVAENDDVSEIQAVIKRNERRSNIALGTVLVLIILSLTAYGASRPAVQDTISRFNPHCVENIDPNFTVDCSILDPKPIPTRSRPNSIHDYYATSEALGTPHVVPLRPDATPTAK